MLCRDADATSAAMHVAGVGHTHVAVRRRPRLRYVPQVMRKVMSGRRHEAFEVTGDTCHHHKHLLGPKGAI